MGGIQTPVGNVTAALKGIALPRDRVPQPRPSARLAIPTGVTVVSSDNHWSVTGDIFHERFPIHLKERAPRLFTDEQGRHRWFMSGQPMIPPLNETAFANFESLPGAVSMEPRMRDLDIEGIEKEIVFGNAINIFFYYPDLEVREWVYRIYNEHLAEMASLAPGRFYGVGLVNYWDPAKAEETVAELMADNLKSLMIPITPRNGDG